MAITNHERVGKALELLKAGLGSFVEREIKSAIAANTISMSKVREFVDDPKLGNKSITEWDAAALLKLMWETWNDVFRKTLGFFGTQSGVGNPRLAQQVGAPATLFWRRCLPRAGLDRPPADGRIGYRGRRGRENENGVAARPV